MSSSTNNNTNANTNAWFARAETRADIPAVREINLAAFPTPLEADLVETLRADASAWLDGLSVVVADADGALVAYALLTRGRIGDTPALCLGPVAVRPERQRTGAGAAAVRGALAAARERGERYVVLLGHSSYYPRFGFTRAAAYGIRLGLAIDAPDEAFMALALDPAAHPLPSGTVHWPAAFGD